MVRWTPKSQIDLDDILNHISKNFNVKLAFKIVIELVEYTEKILNSNPLAGAILASHPLFFKLSYQGNSIYYCENFKDKNLYIVYVQPRKTDLKNARLDIKEIY